LVRADGSRDDEAVAVYQRLLVSLGLAETLAEALVSWMRFAADDPGSGHSGEKRKTVRILTDPGTLLQIPGYDPPSVARLRPYVVALSGPQAVNINTAPALVVAAVLPPMGLNSAHAMVQDRQRVPCRDVADCIARHPAKEGIAGWTVPLSVSSQHFAVRVDARVGDVRLSRQALLKRTGNGWPELIDTRTIAH
jgi:general secretion pathway protein K